MSLTPVRTNLAVEDGNRALRNGKTHDERTAFGIEVHDEFAAEFSINRTRHRLPRLDRFGLDRFSRKPTATAPARTGRGS